MVQAHLILVLLVIAERQWDVYLGMCFLETMIIQLTRPQGPDAKLVASGIQGAKDANEAWKKQLNLGAPLPERWYSSPLR
jgi:hypothetical protein